MNRFLKISLIVACCSITSIQYAMEQNKQSRKTGIYPNDNDGEYGVFLKRRENAKTVLDVYKRILDLQKDGGRIVSFRFDLGWGSEIRPQFYGARESDERESSWYAEYKNLMLEYSRIAALPAFQMPSHVGLKTSQTQISFLLSLGFQRSIEDEVCDCVLDDKQNRESWNSNCDKWLSSTQIFLNMTEDADESDNSSENDRSEDGDDSSDESGSEEEQ